MSADTRPGQTPDPNDPSPEGVANFILFRYEHRTQANIDEIGAALETENPDIAGYNVAKARKIAAQYGMNIGNMYVAGVFFAYDYFRTLAQNNHKTINRYYRRDMDEVDNEWKAQDIESERAMRQDSPSVRSAGWARITREFQRSEHLPLLQSTYKVMNKLEMQGEPAEASVIFLIGVRTVHFTFRRDPLPPTQSQ